MYKNLFIGIITFCLLNFAGDANANQISSAISKAGINKSAVSVSVKDISTGKRIYSHNAQRQLPPASTLKLVTYSASKDILGDDFEYKTILYKSSNNDLYIKLSGDPMLKTADLKQIFKTAYDKKIIEPKNIYIDDTIFDSVEWGEGWQWDDSLNPLMPKFSAYNLDANLVNVILSPTNQGAPIEIIYEVFYPLAFMNLVTTSDTDKFIMTKGNYISPEMINIEGEISKRKVVQLPVSSPSRYFKLRVEDALRDRHIEYYKPILPKILPDKNIYKVDEITHGLDTFSDRILKESNNFYAETLFKTAGAKFTNSKGSLNNSISMLNSYFNKLGIKSDEIKIVDGSGVSKNNLISAEFMTDFLTARSAQKDFEEFKKTLPKPGEGTLEHRMLYFNDKLSAKTGTLSDISAIAGYITTQKGKVYAFDIMINDAKSTSAEKKIAEEYILRAIYANY